MSKIELCGLISQEGEKSQGKGKQYRIEITGKLSGVQDIMLTGAKR